MTMQTAPSSRGGSTPPYPGANGDAVRPRSYGVGHGSGIIGEARHMPVRASECHAYSSPVRALPMECFGVLAMLFPSSLARSDS